MNSRSTQHRLLGRWQLGGLFLLVISLSALLPAQAAQPAPSPEAVPVMDGGVGPCSVVLTVVGTDGKPVYAATVKVHIAYGFAGIRKLDLEAGTNSEGKVKFQGLPPRVHNPPLEFHAGKDRLMGLASYNPASECQGAHDIVMEEPKAKAENAPSDSK